MKTDVPVAAFLVGIGLCGLVAPGLFAALAQAPARAQYLNALAYAVPCWLVGVGACAWLRRRISPRRLLCGAGALYLLPLLVNHQLFVGAELLALALCGVLAGLAMVAVSGESGSRARLSGRGAATGTVVGATAFIAYFAFYCLRNHWQFRTSAFDLAIYENMFWRTIHGEPFATSFFSTGTFLTDHFSLALVLPIAVYALYPSPENMIVFQAVVVGLAALPLFAYARRRGASTDTALLLAAIYLLYPATQLPLFYDFHDIAMLPLFVFGAAWCLETRRFKLAALFFVAIATSKEEGALIAIPLLWLASQQPLPRRAAVIGSVALVSYYLAVKQWFVPSLANGQVSHLWYYQGLLPEGRSSLADLAAAFVLNPARTLGVVLATPKLILALQLFAPLAFLPLLGRRALLLALPSLIVFASTKPAVADITYQYVYYLVPFLFLAVVLAKPTRAQAAAMLLVTAVVGVRYGAVLDQSQTRFRGDGRVPFSYPPEAQAKRERVLAALKVIPADSAVTASETLGPLLAQRKELYTVRYMEKKTEYVVLWRDEMKPMEGYAPALETRDLVVLRATP